MSDYFDMSGVNWNDVDDSRQTGETPPPVPDGWYLVSNTKATFEPIRNNTGMRFNLELSVMEEGDYKGRMIFDGMNVQHPKPTVVKIAMEAMLRLARSIGLQSPSSNASDYLHKPYYVKVNIEPATPATPTSKAYAARNSVVGRLSVDEFRAKLAKYEAEQAAAAGGAPGAADSTTTAAPDAAAQTAAAQAQAAAAAAAAAQSGTPAATGGAPKKLPF